MTGKLRFFVYRDDAIVSQFLEQLEGGVSDEENIRRQAARGGSVGGGVGVGPVGLHGARSRSAGEESEFSVRQTGASRFTRFHKLATDAGEVRSLDGADEDIWEDIEPGEVVEAAVSMEVPDLYKSLNLVGPVSALMPVFEALGSVQREDGKPQIDWDELQSLKRQLPFVEEAAAMVEAGPIPIVASLVSATRIKLALRLTREKVQVANLSDLEGESRLVASVQSKVQRGRPIQVGQLVPGLPPQNRAERRRTGGGDSGSVTLRYPAAVVVPIAIFR